MKENIKQLIEYHQQFMGQDIVYNGDEDIAETPADYLYRYYPKTYEELSHCILEHILDENFDFNDINVTEIESMANLFYNIDYSLSRNELYSLNGKTVRFPIKHLPNFDVSGWEPINCKNFSNMFKGLKEFNCDLSRWDVSKGERFEHMFQECGEFNQDLSNWNVSSAENMNMMFYKCKKFTSDLSNWKVDNVQNFDFMFSDCPVFNSDLSNWNVTNGRSFYSMFARCKNFGSDLSNWETKLYDHMKVKYMFRGCDMSKIKLSESFKYLIKESVKEEEEESALEDVLQKERLRRFDYKPHHY